MKKNKQTKKQQKKQCNTKTKVTHILVAMSPKFYYVRYVIGHSKIFHFALATMLSFNPIFT